MVQEGEDEFADDIDAEATKRRKNLKKDKKLYNINDRLYIEKYSEE